MLSKPYNVPLTGKYNTRISQSNAAAGVSGVWGVGVWGDFIWGGSNVSAGKDERFVNCMMITQGDKDYVIKRPGFATNNTPSSGNVGSAILVWTGQGDGTKVISAFGATTSTIYDGTTSLGAITGKAFAITETFVSTTATLLVSSSDNTAWYYDTGVGVMTKITDADFPGNAGKTLAGTFANLDGYAFIMDTTGVLWNSDLNSVTVWTATSSVSANAYPDKGIGCIRYKNQIAAFGSESIQFFYNAGNAVGSPLLRVDNATIKIGAINASSLAQIADVLFWVGGSPQGGCTVYQFDGSVQRISNPEQDFQFSLSGPDNISMSTFRCYGRSFVLVTAEATTYVYCLEDKRWHEWNTTTPLWFRMAGLSTGTQVLTYAISNISTSGKVFVINPSSLTFQDNGEAFTGTIQSQNDDRGTNNRKFWEELRVVCDIEPSTSTLTVSSSDDDYVTFTTHGTIDISTQNTKLTRLGSSKRRAWKLDHASNTQFRLHRLEGRATIGTA